MGRLLSDPLLDARVRALKAEGLTRFTIARRVGLCEKTVRNILRGERRPRRVIPIKFKSEVEYLQGLPSLPDHLLEKIQIGIEFTRAEELEADVAMTIAMRAIRAVAPMRGEGGISEKDTVRVVLVGNRGGIFTM